MPWKGTTRTASQIEATVAPTNANKGEGKGKGKAKERLLLRAKEAKAQVGHEKLPRQPQCCLRLLPHLDPLRGTSEC